MVKEKIGVAIDKDKVDALKALFGDKTSAQHVRDAVDLYLGSKITIYKITHVMTGKFHIGMYDVARGAEDIYYHFLYTRGDDSVGWAIREDGIESFNFEVIARCDSVKKADTIIKLMRKMYRSKFDEYKYY
jgi:hypothetical protein